MPAAEVLINYLTYHKKMKAFKVKLKFPVKGSNEGVVCYQVRHMRSVRHIVTAHKVRADEWDGRTERPVTATGDSCRQQYLDRMRRSIDTDIRLLEDAKAALAAAGTGFCASDIAVLFSSRHRLLDLSGFIRATADSLRQTGRTRTAETYLAALRSFRRFSGNRYTSLCEIDNETMMQYEAYLKASGVCRNTTSFYMRIMRAVYNRAADKGLINRQQPFRHVYTGVERTVKRAVPLRTIRCIKNADLAQNPSMRLARDMFMFSFYTRGMAFVDMAFLKKSNLRDGILSYRRRKTGQLLFIKWEQCMQDIIDLYPDNPTEYLLPIITGEEHVMNQYRNTQHLINKKLKALMPVIGCGQPLTMYVARHSWASIAHSKNIPLSVISECMGHDSESTTQIYLASLDRSAVDNANRKILNEL